MVTITYIEPGGRGHVVEVEPGLSVMQGAMNGQVRGIIAECGGACSCATCHVYVDPSWIDKVGEKGPTEQMMLEEVCGAQPNSRLSCQIKVSEELEGLVVRMPAKQI
jgi:2Fe-2S ferredoxin